MPNISNVTRGKTKKELEGLLRESVMAMEDFCSVCPERKKNECGGYHHGECELQGMFKKYRFNFKGREENVNQINKKDLQPAEGN